MFARCRAVIGVIRRMSVGLSETSASLKFGGSGSGVPAKRFA
jgi:hypothetical protein